MKFLSVISLFFILGCQADSSLKGEFIVKKRVINKAVKGSYNPAVDILFIIDNSGSMGPFQEILSKNAQLFIDEFLGTEFIDYHIAVTSSSIGYPNYHGYGQGVESDVHWYLKDGELSECDDLAKKNNYEYPNYIERNTPQAGECLREMMLVGTNSPTYEFFFNVPSYVFSRENRNDPSFSFYRPHAHLAVVVITDSYDQSTTGPLESYNFLKKELKKGDESKLHYAAGIVNLKIPQYECLHEEKPPNFSELISFFGSRGYQFNLCQYSYGKDIARFARHLVDSALTIPLEQLPDIDTIKVYYNYKGGSQLISNGLQGWSYDIENNVIRLSRNILLESSVNGKFDVRYEALYEPELEL